MDAQAATLLSTLKRPAASSESKLNLLNALKSDIKHYRVPENAQATIFECLKIAITQQASSTLASSAFSALGHLIKRLKIQDASGHAISQLAPRLMPALHDRMGDMREAHRMAAVQALIELHPFLTSDVETLIRDDAMGGTNPRAKQAGLQWVLKMHKEEQMPFKSYTQSMVARLEDSDGNVRETAKNTLIELFSSAPDRAKTDLKRQMKAFSVRHSIESQIIAQISSTSGVSSTSRPQTSGQDADIDMAASTRSLPIFDHASHFAETINSEAAQPPPQETVHMDPIYVHTKSELEEAFRDMQPHFAGKETEQNWTPRDKAVARLRRLTKGNAPSEFHQAFMAGIKSMVEGILKVSTSLRTTMSTNGCHLVQELARTLGPALDPHVEMFLQTFVKMSASTKHIASENGKQTCDAIFQNCSYHVRLMQHIWNAAQDKNAQIRQCVPDWLKTILKRQVSYKSHFESSGGLDLAEKCIKKGLDDANPKVKESMRGAYWTFARGWPDKSNAIMSNLDPKSKTALERDSNNPNAALHASQAPSAAPTARAGGAASRNALREMMAEQRKAKAAGKLPDRPNSAMAQMSPAKPRTAANLGNAPRAPSNLSHSSRPEVNRVVSTASNASVASPSTSATARKGSALMSGPVRRPRRPEVPRPQTADPYGSKNMLRPETPANGSAGNSPPKGTGNSKSSIPTSSAVRNRAKTAGTGIGSPGGSPAGRSPRVGGLAAPSSRPTSKGSTTAGEHDLSHVREDDLTMVMPKSVSRSGFSSVPKRPGHHQAMSVDNGMAAGAEEEGFTMVMPNLENSQQRARSPLAYRSPLKAMFEEAREKIESMSPKSDEQAKSPNAAEQLATPRSGSPSKAAQAEDVQIYEDPFVADTADAPADNERKVLGELPVNENVRMQSPTQSNDSHTSPTGSPRQPTDPRLPIASPPQDRAEIQRNRRLLASGIDRIRAKTLDAHGFRRLQEVAKTPLDIWQNGTAYAALLTALLDYLQTSPATPTLRDQPPHKLAGLQAQALALLRQLLHLHRKLAAPHLPQALTTVLIARGNVDTTTHLLADVEKTAAEILAVVPSNPAIDAILAYLPTATAPASITMSLTLLRQLLDVAKTRGEDVGAERKTRIVQTSATYLDDADAEVRKADVELASEMFELFGEGGKAAFWGEFRGTDEGRLGLLTYYIARRGRGRVEG